MSQAPSAQKPALTQLFAQRSAFGRFILACLALAIPVLLLSFSLSRSPAGAAIGLLAFAVMSSMAARSLCLHYPHDRLGIANVVTLVRTAIIASLFSLIAAPGALAAGPSLAWTVLSIALFSLSLDGVDGFFARRQNLTSSFGARFDMEVDSVFALLLALLSWQSGKAGAWVLLLGGMRYLFLAAALAWPWLMAPLPERFSRKVICVIQIAILIALLAPMIADVVSWGLAAIGTLLLAFSFGRDVIWLARHRS